LLNSILFIERELLNSMETGVNKGIDSSKLLE